MSIVILANPSSGRGRGRSAAAAIARALGAAARIVETQPRGHPLHVEGELAGARACIVVGGDGTLHCALSALIASGVPVYHAALGTENLFSREFGMKPDPKMIASAIAAGRTMAVDVGKIVEPVGWDPPGYFALMASIGPDAGVAKRLLASRRGSITHFSYVLPVLAELRTPFLPTVTVRVDGREVVRDRMGWLIVGNSRQYGFRADPAVHANMTDGLLDVVFFPAASGMEALHWILSSRARTHTQSPELVYATGRHVEVECDRLLVQADGDFIGESDEGGRIRAEFECVPGALTVLLPP